MGWRLTTAAGNCWVRRISVSGRCDLTWDESLAMTFSLRDDAVAVARQADARGLDVWLRAVAIADGVLTEVKTLNDSCAW